MMTVDLGGIIRVNTLPWVKLRKVVWLQKFHGRFILS